MATTKKKPTINIEGWDMLENIILAPSRPRPDKSHEELVWDEAKRYILSCIKQQFVVQP
ncbi:hypothetical protein BJD52_gp26 [Salmonella phage BP12B]|uniref:Uncharacterized protein n=3 Tax=Zindervirus TaxID=542837 RepID=A0A140XFT1_9CAUD|nr:hypothetical protein BJD52_gp26 [Salmonella phage BP12B]YP_010133131.1 hypothetical protein I132_gp34 [Escherichia phage UAB_Phi78]QZQ75025.1 hypothetical protein [Salmonella phage vB_SenAt-pSL2]URG17636.1 hypothetical protein GRN51_200 [Salmonella phage GRNsp51]UUJ74832.1 hypothetical protein GRNsp03_080 [Salmonella phage GRNsp03]AIT13701.1 hypothetical protein BP12B_25 [Salmonella phage BP12B]QXM18130.1 hypothetical protein UAB78_034 [Escherichia phage UAB_Phi78]